MAEGEAELLQQRRAKLARLQNQGIEPYPNRFHRTHTNARAADLFLRQEGRGGYKQEPIRRLAGRITALRAMGGLTFADIQDGSGRIQLSVRRELVGKKQVALLTELDLGDFLGARGTLFRTRTGEITLQVEEITLLAKALRPPPEKWHGLRDVEQRYRQRYLDLAANAPVRRIFRVRSGLVSGMRRFLEERGFLEVETPILLPVAAGAMATPFVTHHHALDRTLYLRIATELHLKRLIVGGFDKVFEIGRIFRNEGISTKHNPEFTTLESYEAYADYTDVMAMVEEMVVHLARHVLGTERISYQGQEIDLSPPWRRLELRQALVEASGIDILAEECRTAEGLRRRLIALGLTPQEGTSWGQMVDKLISERVEPHLVQPTFLLDYPLEMSPLAKGRPGEPRLVERFEGFMGGMELANAFTELNDPVEQRVRLQAQEEARQLYGEEEFDRLDEDFLIAVEHGMPPTGGLGVGIDRLVMLFTDQPSIRETILFPQLRSRE